MGEYFNGVKLGSCEHLMYVTRQELEKWEMLNPNERNTEVGCHRYIYDYLKLEHNYIYRFPFKDELGQSWDEIASRDFEKSLVISIDPEQVAIPHSDFMQTHINGKVFNLPFCPYSEKATEMGVKKINQWMIDIEIIGERYNCNNPNGYTLFKCCMCGEWFACDDEEIKYIKERMNQLGLEYEAELIKPKIA